MKKDIHPPLHEAQVICACGNKFITLSTLPEIKTEICSACHPFYTGKQKLIDTAGRIEKFKAKMAKAQKDTPAKSEKKEDSISQKKEDSILNKKED